MGVIGISTSIKEESRDDVDVGDGKGVGIIDACAIGGRASSDDDTAGIKSPQSTAEWP